MITFIGKSVSHENSQAPHCIDHPDPVDCCMQEKEIR